MPKLDASPKYAYTVQLDAMRLTLQEQKTKGDYAPFVSNNTTNILYSQ